PAYLSRTLYFPPRRSSDLVASVVFLRAVNVGTTNRCRPAAIAKELAVFGVINIGAVGTFVARKEVSESVLRADVIHTEDCQLFGDRKSTRLNSSHSQISYA